MAARVNRCPNPACAATPDGWQGFTGTVTLENRIVGRGTGLVAPWLRPTGYVAQNGNSGGNLLVYSASHQTGTAGGVAGQVWSGAAQSAVTFNLPVTVRLSWLRADGTELSVTAGPTVTPEVNVPVVGRVVGTGPAQAAGVCVSVSAPAAPATIRLTVTGARLEQVDDPGLVPADGDTAGWAWDAAAGSSSSVMTDDGQGWWALAGAQLHGGTGGAAAPPGAGGAGYGLGGYGTQGYGS